MRKDTTVAETRAVAPEVASTLSLRERLETADVDEARRLLLETLDRTHDPVERRYACEMLGAGGDVACARRLVSLARAAAPAGRVDPALAVLDIAERERLPEDLLVEAVSLLEWAIHDETVAERASTIVRALASNEAGRSGTTALVRLLSSRDEELSFRAARALSLRGEACGRAALERLARDATSPDVRDLATIALEG